MEDVKRTQNWDWSNVKDATKLVHKDLQILFPSTTTTLSLVLHIYSTQGWLPTEENIQTASILYTFHEKCI